MGCCASIDDKKNGDIITKFKTVGDDDVAKDRQKVKVYDLAEHIGRRWPSETLTSGTYLVQSDLYIESYQSVIFGSIEGANRVSDKEINFKGYNLKLALTKLPEQLQHLFQCVLLVVKIVDRKSNESIGPLHVIVGMCE